MIEYPLSRGIMKYSKYLSYPLSFYANQTTKPPFLNLRISANHDKEEGYSVNGEILTKGLKLYCKIYFQSI